MIDKIGEIEAFVINRYAASEIAGSLLLGKMARKVTNPELVVNLTRHCMEEARHAFTWYDLIKKLNMLKFQKEPNLNGRKYYLARLNKYPWCAKM